MGKTMASSISQAAKSKAAQNLKRKAQDAVTQGLADAGGRILQGENVGQVVKDTANKAKSDVTKAFKTVAFNKGQELRDFASAAKKPKLMPKVTKTKAVKKTLSKKPRKPYYKRGRGKVSDTLI